MSLIGITGASGKLGSAIVKHLLTLVPPSSIVACARDTSKLTSLSSQGVDVRKTDFSDPSTLGSAFKGLDKLVIVSVDKFGDEATKLHKAAIEAAKSSGVKTIYYTSQVSASPTSAVAFGTQHAATEADLESSGVAFVSLRNGFYLSSLEHMVGGAKHNGEIVTPQDGKVAWTSPADLAIANAIIIASTDSFPKFVYLTASSSYDMSDIAAILTEAWDKPVKHVVVSPEAYKERMVGHGVPAMFVDFFVGAYKAMENGEFAKVDPKLEELLGRKPQTVEEWFEASKGAPAH
ncbi:putative nucleoside-diphosphate-sugar epimerase [Gymnopus androsaceus JB14]|uniref:Nucleoside-diphosphate-sugar epimerase n=1 Tax=Gymnopus androsaceus JB14 TaxID=1447944 RepID=A0A6A4GF67_9AGAR|nr:putative nucleoside-diphosphate-sugar epimerase [Gymnopus androsaceus JB14]